MRNVHFRLACVAQKEEGVKVNFFNVCLDNLFVNMSYKRTAIMFGLLDWK